MQQLWVPSDRMIKNSNLHTFQKFIENKYNTNFDSYDDLWKWSIQHLEAFWESIILFFNIQFHDSYKNIITHSDKMYETKWLDGSTLNYAAHIFRNKNEEHPAIIYKNEHNAAIHISWRELEQKVSSVQQFLLQNNIQKGDRVVAYLPNAPEAVIAFLACNGIGAIWSCCSPDFGTESIVDRFQQIEPKLFIASSKYNYNGKTYNKLETIEAIAQQIPSLENVILIDENKHNTFFSWEDILKQEAKELLFIPVEFNHPIWILY